MQIIKYFILFLILLSSSMIGRFISKKYVYRLQELEEMRNALHMNQYLRFLKKSQKIQAEIYLIYFKLLKKI